MSYFPFTLSFLYRFLTFLFLSFRGSLESWTIKKAERWRTDAFELRCWRRLLRVPWTAWRSNQSILKEISPEYSLEGLMLKLKLQYTLATWYKELTHWKRPWHWERLKAAGEGEDRGWNDWMASPTWWTWVWATSGNWYWIWMPGVMQPMGSQRDRPDWVTELNWAEMFFIYYGYNPLISLYCKYILPLHDLCNYFWIVSFGEVGLIFLSFF